MAKVIPRSERKSRNKEATKKDLPSAIAKIEKMDSSVERRFLIANIVSDEFCSAIEKNKEIIKEVLPSKVSQLIYGWTSDFYSKYGVAIKASLGNLYSEKEENVGESIADDVKELLGAINKQYVHSDFNWEFEFDVCCEWIDSLHAKKWNEEIEALIALKKSSEAIEKSEAFERLSWNDNDFEYDPYSDEMIEKVLSSVSKPLFNLGGGLGEIMDNALVRGGFVVTSAVDKAGKSFLLNAVQHKATLNDLNVFRFEAGDLDEIDYSGRLHTEISKTPIDAKRAGEQWIPTKDCYWNSSGSCNLPCAQSLYIDDADGNTIMVDPSDVVGYRCCSRCETDTDCSKKIGKKYVGSIWKEKEEAGTKFEDSYLGLQFDDAKENTRKYLRRRKGDHCFWAYPNGRLNPSIIRKRLLEKKKKGISCDVLILDYIDLLGLEGFKRDKRHEIDEVFKQMRALSNEFKCLIFTVTQASASAYNQVVIDRMDFSESKTKLSHVTAYYGMTRTQKDVEFGCCRVQQIISRGAESTTDQAVVLQHLNTGRVNIGSYRMSYDDLVKYHPAFEQIRKNLEEEVRGDSRGS